MKDIKEAFERIYAKEAWGKGKGSGTGSSPVYCALYLEYLHTLLPHYSTVLDLGCGDWQLYRGFKWPAHIRYFGIDVVKTNIDFNTTFYSDDQFKFACADFTRAAVLHAALNTAGPGTLVLIKDVIQHWADAEITRWLTALRAARNWRTVVATNNWKHFRTPAKNGEPRSIDNQYRWAPIDMRTLGFAEVLHYPKGKFKQVAVLHRGSP